MNRFVKSLEKSGFSVRNDPVSLAKAADEHGPFQAMFDWDAKTFYYSPETFNREVFIHESLHFNRVRSGYSPQAGLLGDSWDEVRVYNHMKRLGEKNNFSQETMSHYDNMLKMYKMDVDNMESLDRIRKLLDQFD